jgi:hypothetical protein
MRVLWVWFTAIISVFIITIGWYIGNGVVITIAHQALGDLTGQAFSTLTLLEYVAAWWGPILDLVVIVWAIINSQEIDPNSRLLAY